MDSPQRPRPMGLTMGNEPHAILQRIELMEHVLERSFVIPGIGYRVGFDAIAGLVPVIGDVVAAAMGAYLIWEANNLGLPKWKLWRMAGNVAVDTALGAIPWSGMRSTCSSVRTRATSGSSRSTLPSTIR